MGYVEQNVANSFDFAQKLIRAKDVQEMLELQASYIRNQMQVLAEQTRELSQSTSKLATDPSKSQH